MEQTVYNPLKLIIGMSPDRKLTWFIVLIGAIKILGLDAWIPLPDDPEQAIQVITHANKEIADLAEEIRSQVESGDDSFVSFLTIVIGGLYVGLKKFKEILALKQSIQIQKEKSDGIV